MDSMKSDSSSKTRLEDLSNELLYEIFDYLDTCRTYEIFVHLNTRFNQLLLDSILPLKLHLSSVSKAMFQYQCRDILLPNAHRLQSLRLCNHLLIEQFFIYVTLDSSFSRLENVIISKTKWEKLPLILSALALLPRLSSLTIDTIEQVGYSHTIYPSLLSLSTLKYCKLSFGLCNRHLNFVIHDIENSPLEKLIIEDRCDLDELVVLLACTPHLTLLSCTLSAANSSFSELIQIPMNLSHVCLHLEETSFDEFEWFISSFGHQIRVLEVSSMGDMEYLNANRWERLISSRMPRLHRFDFQHRINEISETHEHDHTLMDKFNSSFWSTKQWFFTHHHLTSGDIAFYSTQPYRWNRYEFHACSCQPSESGSNLANEIELYSCATMAHSAVRFPRVQRLILSKGDPIENPSFVFDLTRVFSPTQITELILSDKHLRLEQLLSLLNHFPNVHFLTIKSSILTLSIPQSSTNRLIINNNQIRKVTILNRCTLEDVQLLSRLCPDFQSLEIEVDRDSLEVVVYYLLTNNTNTNRRAHLPIRSYSKTLTFWQREHSNCTRCARNRSAIDKTFVAPCNHHLSFLCCRDVNYRMIEKLQTMIEKQTLLSDYSMEYVDQNLYLWW